MSRATSSRLVNARRDAVVLTVLITAVMLLIWNGSAFFHNLKIGGTQFGPEVRLASTALTLNVALILFGWRRYVDLQHEAEMRAEHERRAVVLATTDSITGLYNRKGFADRGGELCIKAGERGDNLVVISFQMHRFKAINDQHGYETGDRLLKTLSVSLVAELGPEAVLARLGGDEFAVALALRTDQMAQAEKLAETVLRTVTRPLLFEEKIIQVGAFAGIASTAAAGARIPDILRRADIAMDHARSGRVARPVWFDAGMERALIAHGEIEQGIRVGLEHGQFVPYFEPQIDLATGDIVGFEVLARWIHPLSGVIGPDVFIPVAEEIGLIGRLSEHVISEALREAATWDPKIKISVNISPMQLADGWLAQRIVKILTDTSFPGRSTGDRGHRELAVRGHGPRALNRDQPKEPGRPAGAGRFRDRLLVLVAPALAAVRHHQDRPQLRHQHQCQARERGDRARGHDARQRVERAGVCRRD